jgi:hypothetical protein
VHIFFILKNIWGMKLKVTALASLADKEKMNIE